MTGAENNTHALYFGPIEAPVFGWFHDTATPPPDLGVVLCSPFGREELSGHRCLRTLAQQLAASGLPVLRFDYPGSGDSCEDDESPELVARWTASVHQAVDELKRLSGVSAVAIGGLRIGATLGAQAALARTDVLAFVGIEAVVSGKAFVRELKALQARWAEADGAQDNGLEAGGFRLSASTRDALGALDLRTHAQPPARRMLLIGRDDMPANDRWAEQLTGQGAQVQSQRLPGYAEMMLDPQASLLPTAIVDAAAHWLLLEAASRPRASGPRQPPREQALIGGVLEQPVSFEAEGTRLHGILSLPANGEPTADAILLLNAGATRRIGPNRMHVTLARRWAQQSCAVLRLDLSGHGDSSPCPGAPGNVVYSPTAVSEVACAAEYLLRKVSAQRCHAVGVCAGAYHGLRAAFRGAPLHGVLPINPLVFFWRDGMSIDAPTSESAVAGTVARYKEGLLSLQRWRKLLRGEVHVRHAIRILWQSLKTRAHHRLRDLARTLHIPVKDDLAKELAQLVSRGVSVRFVLAQGDPSNELLRTQGGRRVGRMIGRGDISVQVIPGADHTFSRRTARAVFLAALYGMFPEPVPGDEPLNTSAPVISRAAEEALPKAAQPKRS